ncbi:hypothetical protein D3C78_1142050 [compost metagenome]
MTIPANTPFRTNAAGQLKYCPTKVPIGTPNTFATAKPLKIVAIALPLFSGSTASFATVMATERTKPHSTAVTILVTSSIL